MRHDCSPECDEFKRSVSSENAGVLRQWRVANDDFGTVMVWLRMHGGSSAARFTEIRQPVRWCNEVYDKRAALLIVAPRDAPRSPL
jgi:hypothetical protein